MQETSQDKWAAELLVVALLQLLPLLNSLIHLPRSEFEVLEAACYFVHLILAKLAMLEVQGAGKQNE